MHTPGGNNEIYAKFMHDVIFSVFTVDPRF